MGRLGHSPTGEGHLLKPTQGIVDTLDPVAGTINTPGTPRRIAHRLRMRGISVAIERNREKRCPLSQTRVGSPTSCVRKEAAQSVKRELKKDGNDGLAKRQHMLGLFALESLEVQSFDELRKRGLPGLLFVIVDLPEFLRVHPEFSSHLNLHVSQPMTLLGFDPRNEFLRNALLAHATPGWVPQPFESNHGYFARQ